MNFYPDQLNYTLGSEDATFEMEVLPRSTPHVMAVAGCGSRIIPLLAKSPQLLSCVDISPAQLAHTALRLALLEYCDVHTYREFLGYEGNMTADIRLEIFNRLPLSSIYRRPLIRFFNNIHWDGPIYHGRFEKMLRKFAKINSLVTGRSGKNLFDTATPEAQQHYLRTRFPHRRWHLVLRILGHAAIFNLLHYRGTFPQNNIGVSYFNIYKNIFQRLMHDFTIRESFFLQMIFFGRIKYKEGLPAECDEVIFNNAKQALKTCKIDMIEGDIFEAAAKSPIAVDFLSLSDTPSILPDHEAPSYLARIRQGIAKNGLIVTRAHVKVVRPTLLGYHDISRIFDHLATRERTQLWQIDVFSAA